MKYIALLISLYCSFLAVLPCQDQEEVAAQVTQVIIQNSHAASEQCNQDTCPPFCNCSCCSSARQLTTKAAFSISTKEVDFTYPELSAPGTKSTSTSFWQPPKQG